MKRLVAIVVLTVALAGYGGALAAEQGQAPKQSGPAKHPTVELSELLDAVARKSGKEFLIDLRAPEEVVVGTIDIRDVDYGHLLTVLRNNGLAAAGSSKAVRIVPVAVIRQYELPTLRDNNDAIHEDEWVTRLLEPRNAVAPRLVALLRPLVPQAGHLFAEADSNLLIVVAPYGVTQQLVDVVNEIDQRIDSPQASTQ
ncbi:MAG: hypothetical protein QNJ14_08500 [Woeseiaceae bacterium]|nr:hypothetical protein [Woeseiaceae bacterium]